VLAISASEGNFLYQIDIKIAFLNSILAKPVFMLPPTVLPVEIPPGKVFHVQKGLYGLKSFSRDWYLSITF
jgi:hypothetical protein